MCDRHRAIAEILAWLQSHLPRVRPSEPFRPVAVAAGSRQVPAEVESLLLRLAAEFSPEQLELSGIFLPGDDGPWRWKTDLGPPGSPLIVQREGRRTPPFEILTPTGGLVGDDLPALTALRDHRTAGWLAKTAGRMFVASSTPAVACFRSVRLPATTSAGLSELTGPQWRQLAQRLGWSQPSRPEDLGRAAATVALTLVDWSPETLSAEENTEIRRLAERLARIQRCLPLDMSHLAVWSPSPSEMEDLQLCLELEDLDAVIEALLASADHSSYAISAYADADFDPRCEPTNLIEARREWERLAEQPDRTAVHGERVRQAEARYQAFVRSQLVDPLREQALASADSLDANLYQAAADAFGELHQQHPRLQHQVGQTLERASSTEDRKALIDRLSQRRRQTAMVLRLVRELKR